MLLVAIVGGGGCESDAQLSEEPGGRSICDVVLRLERSLSSSAAAIAATEAGSTAERNRLTAIAHSEATVAVTTLEDNGLYSSSPLLADARMLVQLAFFLTGTQSIPDDQLDQATSELMRLERRMQARRAALSVKAPCP